MTRKLSEILTSLGDETMPLSYRLLGNLSDLNAQELQQFQTAWGDYSSARRLDILRALNHLAEENIQYDYRVIMRWTLTDADADIRVASVEGLWEDESPHLIPTFCALLRQDASADVRAAAALALGRYVLLGELGDIDDNSAEIATQALMRRFHDETESLDVRRRALEAMAASSQPDISRLIENAFYDRERVMRVSALYAMGRSADPRWIPYLTPELEQDDAELRLEAVRALGELEARNAVPRIVQLIAREQDMEVRLAALMALGQIGGRDARRALEAALDWDDDAVAAAAADALGELLEDEGSTTDFIKEVLGDDDDDFFAEEEEEEIRTRTIRSNERFADSSMSVMVSRIWPHPIPCIPPNDAAP